MGISKEDLSEAFNLEQKRTEAYGDDTELEPEDLKEQVQGLMSKNGFSRIGSGDYRVVYGGEETVVKIAWNRLGIKENKAEYRNWRRIKDTEVERIDNNGTCKAREYLAEIQGFQDNKFGWILMERVQDGLDNVTSEEAEKVREQFERSGIKIDEIEPYNMGRCYRTNLSKEVPVVFDYGGT